jgi:A nuclease family of the HNH/ENDO VII superfamily with conserved AHH
MATQATKEDPFKQYGHHAEDMRVALNDIAPDMAYKLGNMEWMNEIKAGVRYKNGETLSPLTEKMFLASAIMELATTRDHSAALARNLAAAGEPKPSGEVSTHHIVAWNAQAARRSRLLLFAWCIAINDKDNGVHLPSNRRARVKTLPDAIKHSRIHTTIYHSQVFLRLQQEARTNGKDTDVGRRALRNIKQKILNGSFPYLPEHIA